MKNSAGEECVMKFLGSREGFHRVCSIDDSASEYAPLIGSYGLQFRFCPVIDLTDTGTREIVRHRKIVPLYGTPRRSAHYPKKQEGDFKRDFIFKYKWKGLKD